MIFKLTILFNIENIIVLIAESQISILYLSMLHCKRHILNLDVQFNCNPKKTFKVNPQYPFYK